MLNGARKSENMNDVYRPANERISDYFDVLAQERRYPDVIGAPNGVTPTMGLASLPAQSIPAPNRPYVPSTPAPQRKGYAEGGAIGDLNHAFEEVKSLPSNYLQKELTQPTGALPDWVIMGELHSRDALRKSGGKSFIQPYTLKDQMLAGVQSSQPPPRQFAGGGLLDLLNNPMRARIETTRNPEMTGQIAQGLANMQQRNQPAPMSAIAPGGAQPPIHTSALTPQSPNRPLPPIHYAKGGIVGKNKDLDDIYQRIEHGQKMARKEKIKDTDTLARKIGMAQGGWLPDVDAMQSYIIERSPIYGIDPNTAIRVARSEGLKPGVWQSNVVKDGVREPSFGPFQLYEGGGLGNKFTQVTGLSPRDPTTWKQQIDFALSEAAKQGWTPWYGARNTGIAQWEGIGGNPASYAGATQGAAALAGGQQTGQQAMIQAAQQAAMEQQIGAAQASAANAATQMMNPASPVSGLASLMPMLMMGMKKEAPPPIPTEVHQQIPPSVKYAGMEPLSPYAYSQTKPVNNTGHIV